MLCWPDLELHRRCDRTHHAIKQLQDKLSALEQRVLEKKQQAQTNHALITEKGTCAFLSPAPSPMSAHATPPSHCQHTDTCVKEFENSLNKQIVLLNDRKMLHPELTQQLDKVPLTLLSPPLWSSSIGSSSPHADVLMLAGAAPAAPAAVHDHPRAPLCVPH